jgi:hypothetical protein
MKKIEEVLARLQSSIGEETLLRELEGIYSKHQGLSRRTRKPGRVKLCARQIQEFQKRGGRVDLIVVADCAASWGLGQASVYRLIHELEGSGIDFRAVDVIRTKEWKKGGIY